MRRLPRNAPPTRHHAIFKAALLLGWSDGIQIEDAHPPTSQNRFSIQNWQPCTEQEADVYATELDNIDGSSRWFLDRWGGIIGILDVVKSAQERLADAGVTICY